MKQWNSLKRLLAPNLKFNVIMRELPDARTDRCRAPEIA